jgi:hypothetical protein
VDPKGRIFMNFDIGIFAKIFGENSGRPIIKGVNNGYVPLIPKYNFDQI